MNNPLEKLADIIFGFYATKEWFKAKLVLLSIGMTWLSLIIIMSLPMLVAFIHDKLLKPKYDWLYSIMLAQDYTVNAIHGGHHDTTVSSLLGHLKQIGSKTGGLVANFVDLMFKLLANQDNHCEGAIQKEDIYDYSSLRAIAGVSSYMFCLYCVVSKLSGL